MFLQFCNLIVPEWHYEIVVESVLRNQLFTHVLLFACSRETVRNVELLILQGSRWCGRSDFANSISFAIIFWDHEKHDQLIFSHFTDALTHVKRCSAVQLKCSHFG